MSLALLWIVGLLSSAIAIRLSMVLAGQFGIFDRPGGHKQHAANTPFIGGVGIFGALVCILVMHPWQATEFDPAQILAIALGSAIIFFTGFADDILNLNYKKRFAAQAVAACIMGLWGGVMLQDLGEIIPGIPLELGILALPFTIFATIGVINALNMIDGIDGLSGMTALISLFLTALVAFNGGDIGNTLLIVALIGAVAGFLYFNLRYPTNKRARVFLGDNGSMLLGFLFAWLFIDLSQGEQRSMTPVTALWIFAVPLMDTVGVMTRRVWMGRSPFRADRNHLHHLFMRASFRVSDTVYIIAALQLLLGGVGLLGLYHGVPEFLMFGLFLAAFAGYLLLIARPWRVVPNLRSMHRRLGFASVHARGLFVGYVSRNKHTALSRLLANELGNRFDYSLSLHESVHRMPGKDSVYAVVEILTSDDDDAVDELKKLLEKVRKGLKNHTGIQVRQFINRDTHHDRRGGKKAIEQDGRTGDRRSGMQDLMIQMIKFTAQAYSPAQAPNHEIDPMGAGLQTDVAGNASQQAQLYS